MYHYPDKGWHYFNIHHTSKNGIYYKIPERSDGIPKEICQTRVRRKTRDEKELWLFLLFSNIIYYSHE